ncbi:MAG: rRNA maturation RNase YbeY [Spirochaetaceae bacterium]|jgi:probable rRNA maturation factor|nr:rRNA maturation RNase YbeY [Spirochaetaceae bacterium]
MNRACVLSEEVPPPAPRKTVRAFAERVLDALNAENRHITIVFCDNPFIRSLNKQYRQKDEPTDVLSFTLGETRRGTFYAGDIVISVETLEENAKVFSVGKEEELRRLIIHGILHLSGMDHATNDYEREAMLVLQEKLLKETAWT